MQEDKNSTTAAAPTTTAANDAPVPAADHQPTPSAAAMLSGIASTDHHQSTPSAAAMQAGVLPTDPAAVLAGPADPDPAAPAGPKIIMSMDDSVKRSGRDLDQQQLPQLKKSGSNVIGDTKKRNSGNFSFKKANSTLAAAAAMDLPVTPNLKSARDTVVELEPGQAETSAQNAHALSWEQVMTLLETNGERGLSKKEAELRLTKFGPNKLAESPPEPFWHKVFRQINSILIYILLIAAAIAGGFQEWAEFGLILGVVTVNVVIGMVQEGKAERATQALKAMLSSKATVIRDGERMEIASDGVVPGDLVFMESGNKVPADIRLVQVSNLAIQESMLTGESLPVNKKCQALQLKIGLGDRKNMAFSATNVIKGQGKGIVVATGDETEIGKINTSVSEVKEEKTQLIKQVDAFGVWIGLMVLPIALASFLLAYFSPSRSQYDVSYAFIEAVAIAVAIIPEGLPAIITITLSLGTSHMAKHHAIVKALPSVETLGSVMVICSDKTGTLTKNEMTVVQMRTQAHLYKVTEVGYDPANGKVVSDTNADMTKDLSLQQMVLGSILCNESRLERAVVKDRPTVLPVGDPTEVALCTVGEKMQIMTEQTRVAHPKLGIIPFESEHKFMCTFHAHPEDKTKIVIYAKGAPDRLVTRCATQLDENGTVQPIQVDFWQQQAMELSGQGLRCLAVCTIVIDSVQMADAVAKGSQYVTHAPEPFLTFLGLACIMDPPRQECIQAIKEAHSAGIVVKMITGDHPGTAKAIGQQLGIVDAEHGLVKTGPEVDQMSMEQLREVVLQCNVYARASPENKISIVRALQAEGKVCSMTGDGVNDAPALRAADIGVAMGITGTDVSKDAAKMILTDDNFATILVAVKEGRRVWDNLRKLLLFNMPASFAQGGVVFFALCLQWATVPLSAIQILYVNMITACTLGLMLAVEPCEDDIMQRPPRLPTARLLGLFFYWRTFFVATVFIFFVLGSVAWINAIATPYWIMVSKNTTIDGVMYTNFTNTTVYAASEALQHSIALNTLVFCETVYAFNCRYLKKSSLHPRIFFGNRLAWLCAFVMIALQMLITYVPGLNSFFSMGDMSGEAWGIVILFAVLLFLIVELEKALTDPLKPYTKPCIERIARTCCSWKCRRYRGICCQGAAYEPHAEPKPTRRVPPKLKQGASLRFIPDKLVQDHV